MILPYLTLPYLTLPYLTLPYLTLPYLTLPYIVMARARCSLKEIENIYSVFLSSCRNKRESLAELEKAVETLACGSCSHSISRSPKLPLVFLFNN